MHNLFVGKNCSNDDNIPVYQFALYGESQGFDEKILLCNDPPAKEDHQQLPSLQLLSSFIHSPVIVHLNVVLTNPMLQITYLFGFGQIVLLL